MQLLAFLIALAVFLPVGTRYQGGSILPAPPGIKPEWYFLAQFQTLKLIPAHILHLDGEVLGILGFGLGGAVWLALPFIEVLAGARRVRWVQGRNHFRDDLPRFHERGRIRVEVTKIGR